MVNITENKTPFQLNFVNVFKGVKVILKLTETLIYHLPKAAKGVPTCHMFANTCEWSQHMIVVSYSHHKRLIY